VQALRAVAAPFPSYRPRQPQDTTLYAVVRDNLETLYGAVDEGAVTIALPAFVKKELEGYLDCGVLCRGFARLKCESCGERRLVAFSCKGRGFCPSCLGRRMASTAANLVEHVLPPSPLRQWVLTVPYPWRKRLAYDGELLGALTRIFVSTVLRFYAERMKKDGAPNGQSGAVVVVQRTSSDLKLNPHLHVLFLDGAYRELGDEAVFRELPRLSTREVGEVLERAVQRMTRFVRRRERSGEADASYLDDDAGTEDAVGLAALAASAASGRTPPAGPEWRRKRGPLPPLVPQALAFDKPLCASLDGFTLHAATRAGALDALGREALCKYVLRPAVAQERVTRGPDGLVRITLKKPFSDGTVAVDMDPLSLLCRLASAVPPPRFHTVRYAGVLAPASKMRPRIVPKPPVTPANDLEPTLEPRRGGSRYRPWAELLKRCFSIDVLRCPSCDGRLRLVALLTDPDEVRRFLRGIGEPTEAPARQPARGPPYWQSRVLRRSAHDDDHVA
jgi:hypothetical protein